MSREVIEAVKKPQQSSMRDVYYVLFRHKWKMVVFFLAVTLTVLVLTYRSPEVYRSEAKLFVRLGRESVTLDPTVTTGQVINVSQNRDSEVNVELEILKSMELLEQVVDSIGQERLLGRSAQESFNNGTDEKAIRTTTPQATSAVINAESSSERSFPAKPLDDRDRDRAIHHVMKNLQVKAQKDSSIINISFESESPELAQNVIKTLINYYKDKHRDVHRTRGSEQFFSQQVRKQKEKLDLYENELQDLKDKSGISLPEESSQALLSRIKDLEGQIGAAEAELAACQAKVQALQKTVSNIPETLTTQETTGFSNQAVDLMRARLYELQLEENDLLSKYTEESQQVQMIRKKVAEARMLFDQEVAKEGRTEVSKGINSNYLQTQSALFAEQTNLSSIQAKIVILKKQLAAAKDEQKAINEADRKIKSLIREKDMQEATYLTYSEKLDQARIDNALDEDKISNISEVQPAIFPTRPVPQRRTLKLGLGILVGILGGIGLAFFFEHIDHSIRTPTEVEDKLLLPALASIPRVRVNRIHPTRVNIEKSKYIVKSAKNMPTRWNIPVKIRRNYSIFREELLLKLNGHATAPSYALAIIGSHHGEGVSTVAANISAVLAQSRGGRVLLVDTNIRCPSTHRIFKTRLEPGLANIPTAEYDYGNIIVSERFKNLHILAAGTPNGSSPRILQPAQFARLINSIKKDYRHVILDMPAMKENHLSARLASLCDAVVLVVEAERLRWEVLLETKAQLLKWNANMIGVVLNKRRFPIPEWLYQML
jgi:capsular exopolysaccharide synthesis family protein